MAPITTSSDEGNHQALLDKLDLHAVPRPFRNPNWKPPQRRNKNVKQVIADASRKETSMMPSQAGSGSSTPQLPHSDMATGAMTPVSNGTSDGQRTNIAQAAQRLDRLVLERNQQASLGVERQGPGSSFGGGGAPMAVTYTNIESAPSLHPNSQKKYCDITGLPTSYTDPKTRLRYYNSEIYSYIKGMSQAGTEGYLAARGAHTVLK